MMIVLSELSEDAFIKVFWLLFRYEEYGLDYAYFFQLVDAWCEFIASDSSLDSQRSRIYGASPTFHKGCLRA
jgi:hypothetical protein